MPRSNLPIVTSVTIKDYKPVPELSAVTLAFSASVYLDGRHVGRAANHGTGDCNRYYFDDPVMLSAFRAYARAWGKEHGDPSEPEDLLIATLCDDEELWRIVRTAKLSDEDRSRRDGRSGRTD